MDGEDCFNRRFSLDSLGYILDRGGILGKTKSSKMSRSSEEMKVRGLDDAHLHLLELNRSLQRINTTRTTTEEEGTDHVYALFKSSSFKNHNKTFLKYFPEIFEVDHLSHAFTCALQKEVLYHGKMYVTQHHLCFHSSVLLKDTKVVIDVSTIQAIKKKNTARIVPNALSITTRDGQKYLFVSLRNRDTCFELLHSVCPQPQVLCPSGSAQVSSAENGHELQVETMSSHSSQEESTDQTLPEQIKSLNCTLSFTSSIIPQVHARSSSTPRRSTGGEGLFSEEENPHVCWLTMVTEKIKSLLPLSGSSNIKQLLIIYLILMVLLLLSSGYIGLRIVALEEQLSTLGAMPDEFNLQKEYKET
ncbi:GRAM domain-containing protein 2A [Electrophorus electricus]|uniref:GRAM domain-containing protein 2A n=1 Tax=Electrophorus electricus TaxID=8005 RepID=UPI0015CF9B72|nr:GRAM domain-containing protein 2A [Electrophorus electricus]